VNLPAASRGASSAQLEIKLRGPLRQISMMLNIFLNHITSHAVAHGASEVPVFPQLSSPQSSSQPRELAEQLPRTNAFDGPYHLTDRSLRRKRHKYMNMLGFHLHLDDLKVIFLTNPPDQASRSFPYVLSFKNLFSILGTPYQVVACIINRMTRSSYRHASLISQSSARTQVDKGDAPLPLITPSARHAFIPAASRGGFCKGFG
jgi:hypothetical protein